MHIQNLCLSFRGVDTKGESTFDSDMYSTIVIRYAVTETRTPFGQRRVDTG